MAGPVRQQFDLPGLHKYVDANIPEIKTPFEVKQFGYGQSNPTYLLTDQNGYQYVMRKKPPGKLLSKTAHRVDREYRIIHALGDTDVPVPKTYGFCEDEDVIGSQFYLMEFLEGRIFDDPSIPGVKPEERYEMWHDAIRTLAKFHRLDPASINMSNYGAPKDFYNRQIKLFKKLSLDQANTKDVESGEEVGKIPHFDELISFFEKAELQPKDLSTFMHGDYKIDNVIFHPTEPRIIGILDWEMSTIGHPLADICNLFTPYTTATNSTAQETVKVTGNMAHINMAFVPGETEGLPSYEQCVKWYTETAGWNPTATELKWGDAFNIFKASVIMQGIAARYAVRQASSEKAAAHGKAMYPFGEIAWAFAEGSKEKQKSGSSKL